jgi:hypothetical protein
MPDDDGILAAEDSPNFFLFTESKKNEISKLYTSDNRRARIRTQCKKTTVLICHSCLINTGVEKINNI